MKTDKQVEAEKEIAQGRLALEELTQKSEIKMNEKMREQQLQQKQKLENLEVKRKQNELEAKEKQKQLLQPASLQADVKQQALTAWSEFPDEWEGEKAAAKTHDTVVTYSQLKDPEVIKQHVAILFDGVPGGVKAELTKMATGVIDCVKSCNSITDAVDARKVEECFNVDLAGDGKMTYYTTRVAVAFRYERVTESKANDLGLMHWFQGAKPDEKTLVGIGYKLEVRTATGKKGAVTMDQAKTMKALGLL